MLRKISVALFIVLALALVPLIATAQAEKTQPQHLTRVDFNSKPEFAEIRVDGAYVGSAPLPYRLTPGVHKIEASRRGFQTWTRELSVSNDAPTNVVALLDNSESTPCPK